MIEVRKIQYEEVDGFKYLFIYLCSGIILVYILNAEYIPVKPKEDEER